MFPVIYLIGSLRNPEIPHIGLALRDLGFEVFDDWHEAGPHADDFWRDGERLKNISYKEALKGWASQHIFSFDKKHLDRCDIAVLVLPAGNSGHLELGYCKGENKAVYILLPPEEELVKLPPEWKWVAGLFEGEGSISCSISHGHYYPRLQIGMTDKDVLEKVVEITGIAKITGPYNKNTSTRRYSLGTKPMYFWQPGKLDEILKFIRGTWHDLSQRRRKQIVKVMTKCGINDDFKTKQKDPYDFRWDQMYNFADDIAFSLSDLKEILKRNHLS